ncbi:MAG: cbb3-type cytochrome oxidase assembly protein CcoS [Chitinophagia bacterium]|jgi:cbb3-type cytochrome oxidase maturation protein|nr:cbb3-type cytochrome oxidase assembly protein CcoS [Chitinophagia bacterium]
MSVIIILLIVSLSIATLFLVAFIWNVKNGQYDDEVSPAIRILFDDRTSAAPSIREEIEPQTSTIENHF